MTIKIPAKKMATYRATARQRREQRAQRLAERRRRAWKVAAGASRILIDHFKAR